MNYPYPILLERKMSTRLWGGRRLAPFLGVEPPTGGEPYAEAWQVYAENRIVNGKLAGMTLAKAASRFGASLLGTASVARYGNRVPLLAKFIDAAKPLSIQVHPDDDYARTREAASGHLGKAEAWYVLECEAGAEVIWGFRRNVTPDEVRSAVASGTLDEHVNRVPVVPGQVIYNPAGTVHAIGAGLFLFEIQQASDLTYRLYDYGRRGADGRERELHVDKALDVADLDSRLPPKVSPLELEEGRRLLLQTPYFAMEAVETTERQVLLTSAASLEILTLTAGECVLWSAAGELTLVAGQSVVLPAVLGDYALEGVAQLLRCYVPVS